jgi:serine/threonine-protein kinase
VAGSDRAAPGEDSTVLSPGGNAIDTAATRLSPPSPDSGRPSTPGQDRPPGISPPSPAEALPHLSGSFVTGQLLGSRYRIDQLLGAGGMGAVYKAQDLDLGIPVAVKVIRPEVLGDSAGGREFSQRFKQELLLARQVTHRNVLRIHDLGEAEGTRYITMPFIEGRDLAHILRDGPMPFERILPLARQMASGLAAAHDAAVVHRDLKPHNILIDKSDTAYISDFGLAKSLSSSTGGVTQPGEFLGTPRYVAPEQVEGAPVDHRTDIYAFGLILYEMATGNVPFTGTSIVEILMKRVREAPRDLREVRPDIPDFFARIVMRCLARDPAARYQSAHEIVADLDAHYATASAVLPVDQTRRLGSARAGRRRWLMAGGLAVLLLALLFAVPSTRRWILPGAGGGLKVPPPSAQKLVAVLPLKVVGDQAALAHLATGIADALAARLFAMRQLRVSSGSEVEQLGPDLPLEKVGRELGVNMVFGGTLTGGGDHLRIVLHLDDLYKRQRVWSQEFTGMLADLLTLQDQVFNAAIGALEVSPTAEERARQVDRPTENLEAYDLYLKGRNAMRGQQDPKNVQAALEFYDRALARDPRFALAYAGVATASMQMYRETKDRVWADKAVYAAEQAGRLAQDVAEVHASLGSVYLNTGRHAEALAQLRRALELAPNSDEGHRRLGYAYLAAGKEAEALAALTKAIEVNPYNWLNHNQLGAAQMQLGHYPEAIAAFRKVIELEPDNVNGWNDLGAAQLQIGEYEQSVEAFQKALALQPTADTYTNLGIANAWLGRFGEARPYYEKAVELAPNSEAWLGNLGDVYRWLGDRPRANATYDRAIALAYKELQVNPASAVTRCNLGLYYAKKGEDERARPFLADAAAADPTDVSILYNQAVAHALAGRVPEAAQALEKAVKAGYPLGFVKDDPDFKTLWADPRFASAAKRLESARRR